MAPGSTGRPELAAGRDARHYASPGGSAAKEEELAAPVLPTCAMKQQRGRALAAAGPAGAQLPVRQRLLLPPAPPPSRADRLQPRPVLALPFRRRRRVESGLGEAQGRGVMATQ